jgi:hypothetical protein
MKMKSLAITAALCSLMILPLIAVAQDELPMNECLITPAEITNLREPQFGVPSMFDYLEQGDGMEAFSDVIPLEDKGYAAFGSFTKDKEDKLYHPLIVRYDEHLKKVWEVRTQTTDYKTIHRALKIKDGFVVLGDIQSKGGNGVYLGFYGDDGKLKTEVPVYERGGNLDAKGLVLSSDDTGYIAALQFIDGKDQQKQRGILYKFSKTGKQIWKRSYTTGNATIFHNILPTLDGRYMVPGQIVMDKKETGAWLLRIDNKGAIVWQRIYPRGDAAALQSVAALKDGSYIVTGKSRPAGTTKNLAAWVMKVDSAGNPVWQRYFRGPYHYEAPDVVAYEDGRAKVLINAQGYDVEHRSHARLLTFSPEGKVHEMEDFTDGQNANTRRLVVGLSGEHLTAGFAQTSFPDNPEEDMQVPVYTYDGWLRAGVPLDLYDDPCAVALDLNPILP